MKSLDVFKQLLHDGLEPDADELSFLSRAVVLHTHSIVLRPEVRLDDVKPDPTRGQVVLAPLTRTHVAELLASRWPANKQRGRDAFWLGLYEQRTPYEVVDDVPEDLRAAVLDGRDVVAAHMLVQ